MEIRVVLFSLLLAPACSPSDGNAEKEKPFYTVSRFASGPLTMKELSINIPDELSAYYPGEKADCLLLNVEELAAEMGDPARLNPSDFDDMLDAETWHKLSHFNKRNILAQVIISRAGALCS